MFRALAATLTLLLVNAVLAHATIVLGTLTVSPDPPNPGKPIDLRLDLGFPATGPVEDAIVRADLILEPQTTEEDRALGGPAEDGPPELEPAASVQLSETSPGVYQGQLEVSQAGEYVVRLRDQTYPQEEAVAEVVLAVGRGELAGEVDFIFPPTATSVGLSGWLLWVVGLPLVAGLVITALVLRDKPSGANEQPRQESKPHT